LPVHAAAGGNGLDTGRRFDSASRVELSLNWFLRVTFVGHGVRSSALGFRKTVEEEDG
jgi:hypothetical protein